MDSDYYFRLVNVIHGIDFEFPQLYLDCAILLLMLLGPGSYRRYINNTRSRRRESNGANARGMRGATSAAIFGCKHNINITQTSLKSRGPPSTLKKEFLS